MTVPGITWNMFQVATDSGDSVMIFFLFPSKKIVVFSSRKCFLSQISLSCGPNTGWPLNLPKEAISEPNTRHDKWWNTRGVLRNDLKKKTSVSCLQSKRFMFWCTGWKQALQLKVLDVPIVSDVISPTVWLFWLKRLFLNCTFWSRQNKLRFEGLQTNFPPEVDAKAQAWSVCRFWWCSWKFWTTAAGL